MCFIKFRNYTPHFFIIEKEILGQQLVLSQIKLFRQIDMINAESIII
jgi:hypothetical protein